MTEQTNPENPFTRHGGDVCRIRQTLGLTRDQFSAIIGLNKTFLILVEQNKRPLSLRRLIILYEYICQLTNVETHWQEATKRILLAHLELAYAERKRRADERRNRKQQKLDRRAFIIAKQARLQAQRRERIADQNKIFDEWSRQHRIDFIWEAAYLMDLNANRLASMLHLSPSYAHRLIWLHDTTYLDPSAKQLRRTTIRLRNEGTPEALALLKRHNLATNPKVPEQMHNHADSDDEGEGLKFED